MNNKKGATMVWQKLAGMVIGALFIIGLISIFFLPKSLFPRAFGSVLGIPDYLNFKQTNVESKDLQQASVAFELADLINTKHTSCLERTSLDFKSLRKNVFEENGLVIDNNEGVLSLRLDEDNYYGGITEVIFNEVCVVDPVKMWTCYISPTPVTTGFCDDIIVDVSKIVVNEDDYEAVPDAKNFHGESLDSSYSFDYFYRGPGGELCLIPVEKKLPFEKKCEEKVREGGIREDCFDEMIRGPRDSERNNRKLSIC